MAMSRLFFFQGLIFRFVSLLFYVQVNNFSVMSGRSHHFLGITSTFGEWKCLALGHNTVEVGIEPRLLTPESDAPSIRPPRSPKD